MIAGGLQYSFNVGSGQGELYVNVTLTDDRYHVVHISRRGKSAHLTVDETVSRSTVSPGDEQILEFNADNVYVGGSPDDVGFSGCLKDPRYGDSPLPLQGSNDVARAEPLEGVRQGCDCPTLCGRGECVEEGKTCIQEDFDLCFSFQCVDFSCSLCAENALCEVEQQRCVCPPGYIGGQCDVSVGLSVDNDKNHVEVMVIAAIVAFLAIVVVIGVLARWRIRQRRTKLGHSEVAGLSNGVSNVRLLTSRRYSDFQTVIKYGDEGGGEGVDDRYTAAALSSLRRYRRVSAQSDYSKSKVKLKSKSPAMSSNSSPLEYKQNLEDPHERMPERVVGLQSGEKAVRFRDSPASSLSTPLAKRAPSPDDIIAILEDRLNEEGEKVERTFPADEKNEYSYEGDCSDASGLSSICGSDHELENSTLSFDFLQGLDPSFKAISDIYVDDGDNTDS